MAPKYLGRAMNLKFTFKHDTQLSMKLSLYWWFLELNLLWKSDNATSTTNFEVNNKNYLKKYIFNIVIKTSHRSLLHESSTVGMFENCVFKSGNVTKTLTAHAFSWQQGLYLYDKWWPLDNPTETSHWGFMGVQSAKWPLNPLHNPSETSHWGSMR